MWAERPHEDDTRQTMRSRSDKSPIHGNNEDTRLRVPSLIAPDGSNRD